MKLITLIALTMTMGQALAMSKLPPPLKKAFGRYEVSKSHQSDHYCKELFSLELAPMEDDKNGIMISTRFRGGGRNIVDSTSKYGGINTRAYKEIQYLNGIERRRNVFRDNQLVIQSKMFIFAPWLYKYKDWKTVIEVLDSNTILYDYDFYGTSVCVLEKVSLN